MDGQKKRKLPDDIAGSASADPSRGALKRILEVVGKEQVVDLVLTAAALHPDFLEIVNDVVGKDPTSRKLFVRGLGFDTTTETLRQTFSVHGDVVEGTVIADKVTGRSRGFGFVTFRDLHGALSALRQPTRVIDDRLVTCQLAAAGPQQVAVQSGDAANRKIYVGNVPPATTFENLKSLFAQFGEIEEGPIGFDKVTQKSRGYGLILYKSEESAKKAMEATGIKIEGQELFCKLATDGGKTRPRQQDTQALLPYSAPAGSPAGMANQVAGYGTVQFPSALHPQQMAAIRYLPADGNPSMGLGTYVAPAPSSYLNYGPALTPPYPTTIMGGPGGSQLVVANNGQSLPVMGMAQQQQQQQQQYVQQQQQQPQYMIPSGNGGLLQQTYGATPPPPPIPNPHQQGLSQAGPQPQLQQSGILGTPVPSQLPFYAPPHLYQQQLQQAGGAAPQYANMPRYEPPQQQMPAPQEGTGGILHSQPQQPPPPPVPSQSRPS